MDKGVTIMPFATYHLLRVTVLLPSMFCDLSLVYVCAVQGVDIFSKDFLFIPIHDALHWSLIIVCHPGLELGQDTKPYILHLDSMQGWHPLQLLHA